jgi:hypothetical protein
MFVCPPNNFEVEELNLPECNAMYFFCKSTDVSKEDVAFFFRVV